MEQFSVIKVIDFCYGHRLFNYNGKCKHLHGHNGRLEIEITSNTVDELGMVIDFGEIKRIAKQWIDDNMDHKMLLFKDDPLVSVLRDCEEPLYLMDDNPTAENIAKEIYKHLLSHNLNVSKMRLWETENGCATYCGE
ncbi:6-pyruvoyl trahydropterin synthase family protein [Teredinibacter purpureus]|uniref:6-pyruvoyl trahydropterin synthase family protein n=1 Tax=Teredinibacter purpureus TaxID=2731756 RepID=UPI0005F7FA25|nr:6-carboxytetrahydropterin synthase [Teredinibacter purpureus]